MTVFEIDQPRVIEFKSTTLAGLRAAPTALRDAGLDSDRPHLDVAGSAQELSLRRFGNSMPVQKAG
jgi:hypothetical protein